MLQELSDLFLNGNNEVLLLVVVSVLCIGPLILMWRSTYVANRPYNLHVTIPIGTATTAEPHATSQLQGETESNAPQPSASRDSSDLPGPSNSNASTSNASPDVVEDSERNSSPILNISNPQSSEVPSLTPSSSNINSADLRASSQTQEASIPELLPDHYYIRLKFLDETVQVVQAKPTDTVEQFRRKIFPENLMDRYRLIFKGSVLRNNEQTMRECGVITEKSTVPLDEVPVVHCFLAPPSPTRQGSDSPLRPQTSLEDLSISNFFLPLLGSILSFLWYLCIYYTSLFTIPSLFGIVGLSCFFLVLVVNRFL